MKWQASYHKKEIKRLLWSVVAVVVVFILIGLLGDPESNKLVQIAYFLLVSLLVILAPWPLFEAASYFGLITPRRKRTYLSQLNLASETRFLDSALSRLQSLTSKQFGHKQHLGANLIAKGDYWQLYDVTISGYTTKSYLKGAKNNVVVRYSVCEMKLRQAVVQLVFDSKIAKGRQFKAVYSQKQKISLNHQLERIFDSYCRQDLKLEALSFITPEVIEALIDTSDYDVEFVGDRLFCYRPMVADKQLKRLQQKALALHSSVNDNLGLAPVAAERPAKATALKGQLLENPYRYRKLAIWASIFLIPGLLSAIFILSISLSESHDGRGAWSEAGSSLAAVPLLPPVCFLGLALINIKKAKARNRRLLANKK